jgi:hypothetical protein
MTGRTERTGVLVVRAWIEEPDDSLRARITGRLDVARADEMSVTVVDADAAVAVVAHWLSEFVTHGPCAGTT